MRLMSSEKGAEQPLDTLAKRKKDSSIWEQEMIGFGLTEVERSWLHEWLDGSYGICENQEVLMSMLMEKEIGGHSLMFADSVRKSIARLFGDLG